MKPLTSEGKKSVVGRKKEGALKKHYNLNTPHKATQTSGEGKKK